MGFLSEVLKTFKFPPSTQLSIVGIARFMATYPPTYNMQHISWKVTLKSLKARKPVNESHCPNEIDGH